MLINSPNISGSLRVTGNTVITGSLTVLGGINATITGSVTTASYVEYSNVANKPTLVSGSAQVSFNGITDKPTLVSGSAQVSFNGITDKPTLVSGSSQIIYSGISGIPSGIVSSSTQIGGYGIFATTGSNQFNGSQAVTGSLTVTGQVVAQTLNVQQVTSSIVYSSGSNVFGNSLGNTQQFTGSLQVSGSTHYLLGSVGVGTTSLVADALLPLQINAGSSGQAYFASNNNGGYGLLIGYDNANGYARIRNVSNTALTFETNNSEKMRLTNLGNLGLGVTPSTWFSDRRALQVQSGGSINGSASTVSFVELGANFFHGSLGDTYIGSSQSTKYRQLSGAHEFYTALSGTAGNAITFTQAMTLDASGRLGIGTTSPGGFLELSSANSNNVQMLLVRNFATSATGNFTGFYTAEVRGASASNITHAMLVHSNENNSGRRILDVTSLAGTVASFVSNGNVGINTSSPTEGLVVARGALRVTSQALDFTAGTRGISIDTTGGDLGRIYTVTGTGTATPLALGTNNTERLRIDTSGRIITTVSGVNGQLQVFQSDAAYNVDAMMYLFNNRNSTSGYHFAKFYAGYPDNTHDVEFAFRGDGTGYSDGGWTTPASDYAEYFESVDGTALQVGSTVVLENGKIRQATESDTNIIGAIRPKNASLFLGNNEEFKWNQKYLKDDFGAYILDVEGMRTLNPQYNPEVEYISREKRDEWNIVGLVGQIPILKSQPVGSNWVKMYDVSSTVEMWLIK
jgi:hypothetical protein